MISKDDLLSAIAECQGERYPNANTCIKLAAYYTILEQMDGKADVAEGYSTKNGNEIRYESRTAFSSTIKGKDIEEVLPVIDEIMETLSVLNPRLYECAMRKLEEIR